MQPRTYAVLPPEHVVAMGGKMARVADWAAQFRPEWVAERPEDHPKEIGYEMRHTKPGYRLVYYAVWANETHPNVLLGAVYTVWRWLYYGSVIDIEFVALDLRPKDGAVETLTLETAGTAVYHVALPAHQRMTFRQPQLPIVLRIQTWNHLATPVQNTSFPFIKHPPKLVFWTDVAYQHFRMSRRSAP